MKKIEKPFFVSNLAEQLKTASGVILVDYHGLSVKKQQDLKKKLKETGSKMLVAKNTLLKIAANSIKMTDEITSDTVLSGPTATIITEGDPISTLQILHKFIQENEIPQMKVGIIDGAFQSKETLLKLAKLPGKSILYGQLLGSLNSPAYGLVTTLQGNMQKLIYILKKKIES